jgi:hypothetical protein
MKSNPYKFACSVMVLCLLTVALPGCGGGGGGGDNGTATTVSGVALSGAPMTGNVFLKDAANNPEMNTTITQNGAFSFDVSGKTAPFMLRAGSLYSMSSGSGTANINPMTHLMVADAAAFTNMSTMNNFYNHPNGTTMGTISGHMGTALQDMRQKMGPLLDKYGVTTVDPVTGTIVIGQGMDRMFDDVKMTIDSSGNVSMMYVNGTAVYTGPMSSMPGGTMMTGNVVTPPATPAASTVTITPSVAKMQVTVPAQTQQFTANIPVTWSVVTTNGGSITSGGLYTGAAVQGMYLVKATSIADPTQSSTAMVLMGSSGMMM